MLDIDKIKSLCKDDTIVLTQHLTNRARERGIKYKDIKAVILNGQIIEQYANDYPYPSCLILGHSTEKEHLHTVIGIGDGRLWIITVYFPSMDRWESDCKTRKVVK